MRATSSQPRERPVLLAKGMCPRSGFVKNELFTVAELRRFTVVLCDRSGTRRAVPRARFVVNINAAGTLRLTRKQLPVGHAWGLTTNKSQGQTCERTVLDVRHPYWEHAGCGGHGSVCRHIELHRPRGRRCADAGAGGCVLSRAARGRLSKHATLTCADAHRAGTLTVAVRHGS